MIIKSYNKLHYSSTTIIKPIKNYYRDNLI